VHLFIGKLVVVHVNARNLRDIINGGNNKLAVHIARDIFWLGLADGNTLSVEWVPREENAFADELSKLLIPDDCMLAVKFVDILVVFAMAI